MKGSYIIIQKYYFEIMEQKFYKLYFSRMCACVPVKAQQNICMGTCVCSVEHVYVYMPTCACLVERVYVYLCMLSRTCSCVPVYD